MSELSDMRKEPPEQERMTLLTSFRKSLDWLESIWFLRGLIVLGIIALLYYLQWLGRITLAATLWLPVLVAALAYSGAQLFGNWLLYLAARQPDPPADPPPGLTVDVFVTAYREPHVLIERTLKAACRMRIPHRTWLLDDGADPYLALLAVRLGAKYITRPDRMNAKAGNLNAALARTNGDIVVIFDVDHAPRPDFLESTLGHFADPEIGFVQVMLTFENNHQSWVARAAAETSLDFYNPTSLGTHFAGSATLMGSNALIRRTALESIGGYHPGLAEDLATSIALHAAGWHSAYVARPLAPGIAPPDLTAWFTQQFKWARGVFELLLTDYLRLFFRLTWGQRVSYAVRMTKYWIGPAVGVHLFGTILILILGNSQTRALFHSYLIHLGPLIVCDALIRGAALRLWQHPSIPRTILIRAVVLIYATWPIYLLAWFMALLRVPLAFRPTPKSASGSQNVLWLLPQIATVLLLAAGLAYTVFVRAHQPSILLLFATVQGVLQLIFLTQWAMDRRKVGGDHRYISGTL